jgi:transcriptional regulator with PAS, ATPase and Fis domain
VGAAKPSAGRKAFSLNEIEKQAIIDALTKTANNRQAAAKLLGISERTLYRKIKEYKL